jgi:hypothetical protein
VETEVEISDAKLGELILDQYFVNEIINLFGQGEILETIGKEECKDYFNLVENE